MSLIKNKAFLFAVVRVDELGSRTICCFTKTVGYADILCSQFKQKLIDSGVTGPWPVFIPEANIFYDE